jgi:hypothetical protein
LKLVYVLGFDAERSKYMGELWASIFEVEAGPVRHGKRTMESRGMAMEESG